MIDNGEMNEAENLMLDNIDYSNRNELAAAALFYQYLFEKNEDFLQKNNYSKEKALDRINQIMQKAGYNDNSDSIYRRRLLNPSLIYLESEWRMRLSEHPFGTIKEL